MSVWVVGYCEESCSEWFFWMSAVLLGVDLEAGLLGHMVILFLIIWDTPVAVFLVPIILVYVYNGTSL